MQRRLKIYALLATRSTLPPTGGDLINEGRFLSTVSRFADVYYNGQLFQPHAPGYGLVESEIKIPEEGYDLYYIRNNAEVFLKAPHPKIVMSYPYSEEVFSNADALVVTTESWLRGLTPYAPRTNLFSKPMHRWYGDKIVIPKGIINIKQVIDPHFLQEPTRAELLEARAKTTSTKAIGFFGRMDPHNFPQIFLQAYKKVMHELPQVKFVVGGAPKIPLDPALVKLARIPHEKMPAMVRACIATCTDEGDDASFLGSGKVLDSMASGVPIIAYKTLPRIEQLGEYYPLYYENEEECCQRIREVANDPGILEEARQHLAIRRKHFVPEARAKALQAAFEELVAVFRIQRSATHVADVPAQTSELAALA